MNLNIPITDQTFWPLMRRYYGDKAVERMLVTPSPLPSAQGVTMNEPATDTNPTDNPPGAGGDVNVKNACPALLGLDVRPGKGGKGKDGAPSAPDGGIYFRLADGAECLAFLPTGEVRVRGEMVADNWAIYEAFCYWLRTARFTLPAADGNP